MLRFMCVMKDSIASWVRTLTVASLTDGRMLRRMLRFSLHVGSTHALAGRGGGAGGRGGAGGVMRVGRVVGWHAGEWVSVVPVMMGVLLFLFDMFHDQAPPLCFSCIASLV